MLQPARLGDIVILLPIAKKYADMGYEVVWPIWRRCSFFAVHAPYVTWRILPVDYHRPHQVKAAAPEVAEWLEPLFGFAGTEKVTAAWKASGMSFDAYKYKLCRENVESKFNLDILRNPAREEELFKQEYPGKPYVLVSDLCSKGVVDVMSKVEEGKTVVKVHPTTDDPLDWLLLMERAEKLMFVDSFMLNLANQLKIPGCHVAIPKPNHPRHGPVLNSYWVWSDSRT